MTSCVARRSTTRRSTYECRVAAPYRLDLTVSVLRRLSSNLVDVLTPRGEYLRALGKPHKSVIARVSQVGPTMLMITVSGPKSEHERVLALVRRMLGVDRQLTHFDHAAAKIPWLRSLAKRMHGVRPPRYPTLWEACVNAIVFQQISLIAASTIMRRLIVALSPSLVIDELRLYEFPAAEALLGANDAVLRAAGLSLNKLKALRRVGEAIASGALDEATLEKQVTPDASAFLQGIKGIGPWTAAVILLRGLGRLDVFPMNDTSVVRNLALVAGSKPVVIKHALDSLSPQQGMLYYHLLLARLESKREIGQASAPSRETRC